MSETPLAVAHRLHAQAMAATRVAAGPAASGDEKLSVLVLCEGLQRQLDQIAVGVVAGLEREGLFAERGYRSSVAALSDLLGWERPAARRRVVAAEQVVERIALDGTVLPARLPVTAAVFAAGRASLRHVEVIARVLGSTSARRLSPEKWAGVEEQLAAKAELYLPSELQTWGAALVEVADEDGAEPPTGTRHR